MKPKAFLLGWLFFASALVVYAVASVALEGQEKIPEQYGARAVVLALEMFLLGASMPLIVLSLTPEKRS